MADARAPFLPDKATIRRKFRTRQQHTLTAKMLALMALFVHAETDLFAVVSRRPWNEAAVLANVRTILHDLTANVSHRFYPAMEAQYAHGMWLGGYSRALLPADGVKVSQLAHELEASLLAGILTVPQSLQRMMTDAQRVARLAVGRRGDDGKELPVPDAQQLLLAMLVKSGFVAYVDTLHRNWSLRNYAVMATKSVGQTATNVGALFADVEHDLYVVTASSNPCSLCAPLEGRIISRSGDDLRFPGLLDIFTDLIDEQGNADDLDNRWLGIHNQCQHYLQRINESDYSADEWQTLIAHSSLQSNPVTIDPRSAAQRSKYRKRARERMRAVRAYKRELAKELSISSSSF